MTREEALKEFIGYTTYDIQPSVEATKMAIKALEQEPKIGQWEMCEDSDGIYGVCSECGQDADFSHYGKAYGYCPNCGAKMETETLD